MDEWNLLSFVQEEEVNNSMNSERRESSLDRKIQDLEVDIDRKEKEKKGIATFSLSLQYSTSFFIISFLHYSSRS